MNIAEIRSHLIGDLTESIRHDIFPVLHELKDDFGYFAVPRLVLSYADYLGKLWKGEKTEEHTSKNAVAFIREFFGKVDINYKKRGGLLYYIYRHGTIHTYQPKSIKRNNNRNLGYLCYKGPRKAEIKHKRKWLWVNHLCPVNNYFPISINCLYFDLIQAVHLYYEDIERNKKDDLIKKFNDARREISTPKNESDIKNKCKSYIEDSDFQ